MHAKYDRDMADTRHLRGFRRFQYAALKALSVALKSLKSETASMPEHGGERAAVKISDMKSLVSAYKEAVSGERMVTGIESTGDAGWPEEMVVRWVDDECRTGDESDVQGA